MRKLDFLRNFLSSNLLQILVEVGCIIVFTISSDEKIDFLRNFLSSNLLQTFFVFRRGIP